MLVQQQLSKKDKSSIGKWDEKIVSLCNKINKFKEYYTTSSCSGRVVIMVDQDKKGPNLFVLESHKRISYEWILEGLKKSNFKDLKFKCEPPIIHIACKDIESANEL